MSNFDFARSLTTVIATTVTHHRDSCWIRQRLCSRCVQSHGRQWGGNCHHYKDDGSQQPLAVSRLCRPRLHRPIIQLLLQAHCPGSRENLSLISIEAW
jgi:hypothetical protein